MKVKKRSAAYLILSGLSASVAARLHLIIIILIQLRIAMILLPSWYCMFIVKRNLPDCQKPASLSALSKPGQRHGYHLPDQGGWGDSRVFLLGDTNEQTITRIREQYN